MNQQENPQSQQNPQDQPPAETGPTCACKCSWWRWPLIVILVALVIMAVKKRITGPTGPGIEWQADYSAALAAAAAQNKPVLLAFHTAGCGACKWMKNNVHHDPAVLETSKQFIPILVMGDKNPDLVNQYALEGFPTYIILKPNATPVETILGSLPPDEFNKKLTAALTQTLDH